MVIKVPPNVHNSIPFPYVEIKEAFYMLYNA